MELVLIIAVAYAGARAWEHAADATVRRRRELAAATGAASAAVSQGATKDGATNGVAPEAMAPRTAGRGAATARRVASARLHATVFPTAFVAGFKQAWPDAMNHARLSAVERAAELERIRVERAASREAEPATAPATPAPAPAPQPVPPAGPEAAGGPLPKPVPLRLVKDPAPAPADADATTAPAPTPRKVNPLIAKIGEVRTHEGLLRALQLVQVEALHNKEEADGVATRTQELSEALELVEAQCTDINMDEDTLAELAVLRESVDAQKSSAVGYHSAADTTAAQAEAASQNVEARFGMIREAYASSSATRKPDSSYFEDDS